MSIICRLIISKLLLFFIFEFSLAQEKSEFPHYEGKYLGQKAPVKKAEVFLDGVISKLNRPEMCGVFNKTGKEFYFNTLYNDNWTIFYTKEIDGKWQKPICLPFTSGFTDRDFTMTPDGNKIFFGSNRPREKGEKVLGVLDIYVTERLGNGQWSEPKNLGPPVNTDFNENYPSAAANGSLYFFSNREGGLGGCDIYVSRFIDGQYLQPENLGVAVNSKKNDWDSFVAPNESYIIFSSQNRDDTIGGQDLYVSFRKSSGEWTEAKNMGKRVNSFSGEICPGVSLDGRYMFFTSRRRGKADIFWIDAKIIDDLKTQIFKQGEKFE